MALEKITEAQLNANGVIAAPDVLNGTAAENKAIFDRLVRSIVAPAYNACVDAVSALEALDTGLKASEEQRTAAETARVQNELKRVAAELERAAAETEREIAEEARQNAETGYVAQANNAATRSQSWAEGGTGSREGENTNNAKYWATKAKENAAGGGDMKKNVYDPQGKATDIFKYVEEHGGGSGVHIGPEPPTNGETVWIDTDDTEGSFYTAAQTDELLSGKVSMEIVWENAAYRSEFLPQTLDIDYSEADVIGILHSLDEFLGERIWSFFDAKHLGGKISRSFVSASHDYVQSREFTLNKDTRVGITFGNAIRKIGNNAIENPVNVLQIPVAIALVKGVTSNV